MRPLKIIRQFSEVYNSRSSLDSPKLSDHVGKLTGEDYDVIINHFEHAPEIFEWLSPVPDPLDRRTMVRSRIYSDGVYAWSEMTYHLAKKHKVTVPAELIEHARMMQTDEGWFLNVDVDHIKKLYPTTNMKNEKTGFAVFVDCV